MRTKRKVFMVAGALLCVVSISAYAGWPKIEAMFHRHTCRTLVERMAANNFETQDDVWALLDAECYGELNYITWQLLTGGGRYGVTIDPKPIAIYAD